ncbi:hypothetical protein EB796_006657 [Bugula neritina]|uniref:RING-type domain-containing protein n=1 Tax=Bugula neritina TaxID=10212 RepID=A0A7J7K9Z7_BUGNE|nr:hypothetical protein EB796_006657 [Bugula neritina]
MASSGPTCAFCMSNLNQMQDPRKLPCDHIFCLDCLKSDFGTDGTSTKCPICGALHEDLDMDELEAVDDSSDKQGSVSKYPPISCSRNCNNNALFFCGECSAKLCEDHKEVSI